MPEAQNRKTLIVIAGPTAVGKTGLAVKVAAHFGTEIISADSRQIYKELSIGTAKPTAEELNQVRHHFIDSHSIGEAYDAASFGKDALEKIHHLFQKYDYVVLCGGSGLYIKAVLEGFDDIPAIDPVVRGSLVAQYEKLGISWLQQQMLELDPAHFSTIDQQNPHRLIRALEVKLGTGFSLSHFQRKNHKEDHPFRIVKIGLALPKEELYRRIDERMDDMIRSGLFQEAELLYPFRHHNALQTVGYQEVFDFMDGAYDREEAIRLLKRNSRRYAKRQLTWFKKDNEMTWFNAPGLEEIVKFIKD